VVLPASCNGLYGVKLRPGSVPDDGVFKLSGSFDGVGVMARNPSDLAAVAEILLAGENAQHQASFKVLATGMNECLAGLSIGVVATTWGIYAKEKWTSPDVVSELGNN
jgi:amidase